MPKVSKEASLPLLPLANATVLLPGAFLRISASALGSPARVEHLLSSTAHKPARSNTTHPLGDVVAVPVASTNGSSDGLPPSTNDEDTGPRLDLDSLHNVGCAATIIEISRLSNHDWVLVLEGRCRVAVREVVEGSGGLYVATVRQLDYFKSSPAFSPTGDEVELQRRVLRGIQALFAATQSAKPEIAARTLQVLRTYGPALTADVVGALLARSYEHKLALLSTVDVADRLQLVNAVLQRQVDAVHRSSQLATTPPYARRKSSSSSGCTTAATRGEGSTTADSEDESDDIASANDPKALFARLKSKQPPQEALQAALRELGRLRRTNEQHPGYASSIAYLETLADLPWSGRAAGSNAPPPQLSEVRARLDADHYGMDKVKERIVQFVAVQTLRGWTARAPVLCLVGPPGVGKTSLAKSIATALHRPFQRISLGGVRDEAEIRGHRRTYVGAMPGRVLTAVRKAGASDAVVLLDEIDKTGRDARGDPAAALLEVLDPEQNSTFVDTYLGVPVDLSRVIFIATANSTAEIPPPLLDRMEMVQLAGYTLQEKIAIGERHLVPAALQEHGIAAEQLVFSRDSLQTLIEGYTREAGVRQLGRTLAALCRHVAVQMVGAGEGDSNAEPTLEAQQHEELVGEGILNRGGVQTPSPVVEDEEQAGGGNGAAPPRPAPVTMRSMQSNCTYDEGDVVARLLLHHAPQGGDPARNAGSWMQGTPHLQSIHALRHQIQPHHGMPDSASSQSSPRGNGSPSAPSASAQGGWFAWLPWHRADPQRAAAEFAASARSAHDPELSKWEHAWQAHGRQRIPMGAAGSATHHNTMPRIQYISLQRENVGLRLLGPGSMGLLSTRPHKAGMQHTAASSAHDHSKRLVHARHDITTNHHDVVATQDDTAATNRFGDGTNGEAANRFGAGTASLDQQQGESSSTPFTAAVAPSLNTGSSFALFQPIMVDAALIEQVLGPRRYHGPDPAERVSTPGAAAGLVWTAHGGQVQYIECLCVGKASPGEKGTLTLTGQLGDVLEESARIAASWARANARALGLPEGAECPATQLDVHIHLPAGGVPKDGPSAGITLAVALVSLFTGKRVRGDTALTGELTLRGLVLPVGGIKEKIVAAASAGMRRVILPAQNVVDARAEVPKDVLESIELVAVERLEQALEAAFDPPMRLVGRVDSDETASERPWSRL